MSGKPKPTCKRGHPFTRMVVAGKVRNVCKVCSLARIKRFRAKG